RVSATGGESLWLRAARHGWPAHLYLRQRTPLSIAPGVRGRRLVSARSAAGAYPALLYTSRFTGAPYMATGAGQHDVHPVWRAAGDSGAHWPRRADAPLRHG